MVGRRNRESCFGYDIKTTWSWKFKFSKNPRRIREHRRRDNFLSLFLPVSPGRKASFLSPRFPNPKKQTNSRTTLLGHPDSVRGEKPVSIHEQPLKAVSDVEIKSLSRLPALEN